LRYEISLKPSSQATAVDSLDTDLA
jgi:hypothetical protein